MPLPARRFACFTRSTGTPDSLMSRRSQVQILPPTKGPGQRTVGQGFYRNMRFFYRLFYRRF
jgi:hypothetical protein